MPRLYAYAADFRRLTLRRRFIYAYAYAYAALPLLFTLRFDFRRYDYLRYFRHATMLRALLC